MASPSLPSSSLSLPRQPQEEKPPKSAPPSSSFFSSLADRWRAYSGSEAATGNAALSSLSSKTIPYSSATPPPSSLSASASSKNPETSTRPATHLCVLVHGLWGRPSDWNVVAERLEQHKRRIEEGGEEKKESLKVLKSRANARRLTLDGIDVCASRLAEEVRAAVAEERERHGSEGGVKLERISFVGHSMGGLIARAAVAELLDKNDSDGGDGGKARNPNATLAGGLLPAHFVSVATPHLGCHAEAEATAAFVAATRAAASAAAVAAEQEQQQKEERQHRQHPALIPLVSWIAGASSVSSTMAPRLLAAAASRASASMGRSGPQFFLTDGCGEGEGKGAEGADGEPHRQLPLLARLADPSLPALRALAAFESRTTFANSSGDHLVGWSNASLRDPRRLPREELRAASAAAASAAAASAAAASAAAELGSGDAGEAAAEATSWFSRRRRSKAVAVVRGGGVGVVLDDGVAAAFEHKEKEKRRAEKETTPDTNLDLVDKMLSSLSSLPWRRVDACFRGSPTPFLAHNHIQATHFFNEKIGRASADAIARAVVEADEELLRRRREGKKK